MRLFQLFVCKCLCPMYQHNLWLRDRLFEIQTTTNSCVCLVAINSSEKQNLVFKIHQEAPPRKLCFWNCGGCRGQEMDFVWCVQPACAKHKFYGSTFQVMGDSAHYWYITGMHISIWIHVYQKPAAFTKKIRKKIRARPDPTVSAFFTPSALASFNLLSYLHKQNKTILVSSLKDDNVPFINMIYSG